MFNSVELYLLNKLLNKIKYSDRDPYELNEFAFSPITNQIIEKLKIELKLNEQIKKLSSQNPKFKNLTFEFDNYIGKNIKENLIYQSDSSFEVISKFNDNELETFAIDIIGPIDFEKTELEKLKKYIEELAKKNTSS